MRSAGGSGRRRLLPGFPTRARAFWSVHGYADIVAASRDVTTYSSGRGISFEEPTDEDMAARRTIIDTDPPEHTKLRKVVSGTFSQRAIAVYEHFIAELTEQVLDRCPAQGCFDFVDVVAKEVPIRVLARIMGLPEADLDLFIDLGDRLIANTDPDITDVVWGRDDTDAYRRYPFRYRRGAQVELPHPLHAAHRHGGHRTREGRDTGRGQGGAVVRVREPGRARVRRAGHL
jgi:cytochrome P450